MTGSYLLTLISEQQDTLTSLFNKLTIPILIAFLAIVVTVVLAIQNQCFLKKQQESQERLAVYKFELERTRENLIQAQERIEGKTDIGTLYDAKKLKKKNSEYLIKIYTLYDEYFGKYLK